MPKDLLIIVSNIFISPIFFKSPQQWFVGFGLRTLFIWIYLGFSPGGIPIHRNAGRFRI
jgi:hypothetical protein